MSHTKELRQVVKDRFFPYLEARGFSRLKSTNNLIQRFQRIVGDRVQILHIQWDKYGDPRFILRFGEGAAGGVRLWGKHIPGESLAPQDCRENGSLGRSKGVSMGSWFQLKKPLLDAFRTMSRSYSPEVVADQLLDAFPEVEQWWQDRSEGSRIRLAPTDIWEMASTAGSAGPE